MRSGLDLKDGREVREAWQIEEASEKGSEKLEGQTSGELAHLKPIDEELAPRSRTREKWACGNRVRENWTQHRLPVAVLGTLRDLWEHS